MPCIDQVAADRRYKAKHPEKYAASRRLSGAKWRQAHPVENKKRDRARRLLSKYGLTEAEWNAKFAAQGSVCAMCQRDTPLGRTGWATDHNRKTGKLRGILCYRCNMALGTLEDDVLTVQARTYLEKHK